jgi:hypothetical protein
MTDLSSTAEDALNRVTATAERYLLDKAAWWATEPQTDAEWEARERMTSSLQRLSMAVNALSHLDKDDLLREES